MKTFIIGLFITIVILAVIATAIYRIATRRWPNFGHYARIVGGFMWRQSRAAPVLAILFVLFIIVVIFWNSCDREEDSPVAVQQEQTQQSSGCQTSDMPNVPLPRGKTNEEIIAEWKREGFHITDVFILQAGEESRVFTFSRPYRSIGSPGTQLKIRQLNHPEQAVGHNEMYDTGTNSVSFVFVGVETTEITVLVK